MLFFLIIGGLGVLLLAGGLLFGDAHTGLLDSLDLGDGITLALGAALGGFGFGGALLLTPYGPAAAVGGGVVAALLLAAAAYAITRTLIGADSPPPRTSDLMGVFGTVVTRIPLDGLGEIVLPQAGSRIKLAARSHEPVPAGTPVYVTEILSATSVAVQRADLL